MTDLMSLASAAFGPPTSADRFPDRPDSDFTSPEAAANWRKSRETDLASRAPGMLPMRQQAAQQEDNRRAVAVLNDIANRAAQKAYEAQGFWENAAWQGGSFLKSVGDSVAWTLGGAYKGLRSAAGAMAMPSGGFGPGWEAGRQDLAAVTGTEDPGILDVLGGGYRDFEGMTLGQRADSEINRKLGNWAALGQTAGQVVGMVADPFAIGKGAAAATRLATGAAERGIARAIAKGAPGATEAIAQGRIWQHLAQSTEWARTAAILGRTMPALKDIVEVGAANVAQSFAMTPDEQRADATKLALITTPMTLPIVRASQKLGGAIMRTGMGEREAQAIRDAYLRMEAGTIGFKELDDVIRANSPALLRAIGGTIASSAEGTAFMAMDPSAMEELQKWQAGDPDALARLGMMWMGTAAGVATGKHLIPSHLSPFFKAVRPDANSLQTFLEAEANKRAAAKKPEPVPELAQEPAQEPEPAMPEGWGALSEPELARQRDELAARHAQWQERQTARAAGARAPKAHEVVAAEADREMADLQAAYAWADGPSLGLLRSGWEPSVSQEMPGVVRLKYGRDDHVDLTRGEDGGLVVRFDPALEKVLAEHGVPTNEIAEGRKLLAPTMVEYAGNAASKVIDDLSIISTARRIHGDMTFQKLGLREVEPGVWTDGVGRLYRSNLDSSASTKMFGEGEWAGREDIAVAGFPDGPQWSNQTVEQLKQWLTRKFAVKPDAAVDTLLMQAIAAAENGTSFGADQTRQFFDGVPFEALADKLNDDGYRLLAIELGSLASGHNNAQNAAAEIMASHGRDPVGSAEGSGLPVDATVAPDEGQSGALPVVAQETLGERIKNAYSGPGKAAAEVGGVVKEVGQRAYEAAIENEADILTRGVPGDPIGYELRSIHGERARGAGEALGKWGEAERALKGPGRAKSLLSAEAAAERKRARDLRKGTIQSADPDSQYMRWRRVGDLAEPASNETERRYASSQQEAGRYAYESQREAGAVRLEQQEKGPAKYVPIPKRDRFVQPFVEGKDAPKVYANKAKRTAWFESLVRLHPDKMVPAPRVGADGQVVPGEYLPGREVPLSVEWLERVWQAEQAAKSLPGAVRESAAEHTRFLENTPDIWRGLEMLEADPFSATTQSLKQQMARAAVLQKYGPDMPADAQRAMLDEAKRTGATNPAVRALMEGRTGVEDRLRRVSKAAYGAADTARAKDMVEIARQALVRAQGGNPEKSWWITRFLRPYVTASSAAMSAPSFLLDIPEPLFRTAAMAGLRRTASAVVKVARNPREAAVLVERLGAMDRQVADMVLDEARGPSRKFADAIQLPGSFTERWKGVLNAVVAGDVVQAFKDGKATAGDRWLAFDMLRLSPEQMRQIASGSFPDALGNQVRRELTQLFTSRAQRGEGSRLAASSNAQTFLRFTRFATKRLESTVRSVRAVSHAAQRSGWRSKDTVFAVRRLVRQQTGMALGGIAGTALSQMLIAWARGDDPREGVRKLTHELTYSPSSALWALAKAWGAQAVGGPMGQLARAAIEHKDAEAIANTTVIGQIGYGVAEFAHQMLKAKDIKRANDALFNAVLDSGIVPFRTHLRAYLRGVQSRMANEDPQTVSDLRAVDDFRRMEGIEPVTGSREREPAFYDAIARIVSTTKAMPNATTEEVMAKLQADLREALQLAPEESVAAAVAARQRTRGISDEMREKMHSYLGDAARISRVYQHDQALRDLAREIGKLEGTSPTTFQQDLEAVRQQAKFGGSDRWRPLMERVVDDATQRLLAGDGMSPEIEELAETMASHPDQLDGLFDRGTWRLLQSSHADSTVKARRIAAVLRKRAAERRGEAVREQRRKEAR